MKIIKNTFTIIILSLLFILLVVSTFTYFRSIKQDEVESPNTSTQSTQSTQPTQKPYTESPVQPKRKPNISDIKYARALMSHPRSKITDINVLYDHDHVIKTAKDNINKGVGNREDYELYNIWKDMNEYEQKNNK